MRGDIAAAMANVAQRGYCVASWQPEVVAVATPLVLADRPIYVLNASVTTAARLDETVRELRGPLLALRDQAMATLRVNDLPPSHT
jgi:hypothetical protein